MHIDYAPTPISGRARTSTHTLREQARLVFSGSGTHAWTCKHINTQARRTLPFTFFSTPCPFTSHSGCSISWATWQERVLASAGTFLGALRDWLHRVQG